MLDEAERPCELRTILASVFFARIHTSQYNSKANRTIPSGWSVHAKQDIKMPMFKKRHTSEIMLSRNHATHAFASSQICVQVSLSLLFANTNFAIHASIASCLGEAW